MRMERILLIKSAPKRANVMEELLRSGAKAMFMLLLVFLLPYKAAGQNPPGVTDMPAFEELPFINELPDPFMLDNGTRITSVSQWPLCREELKAKILYYAYGHFPPPPAEITAHEISSASIYSGKATKKIVRLTMGPNSEITFDVKLIIPQDKIDLLPVIVTGDACWYTQENRYGPETIQRGYAIAEFDRTKLRPDDINLPGPVMQAYPAWDGGAVAIWAWGYMRVVDYLLTQSIFDPERIIVTGHSRGAKAALLAGAFDERIALTAPNGSGTLGTAAARLYQEGNESVARITTKYGYWFHPRLAKFGLDVRRLPFDQHSLIALVAPRAFFNTTAADHLWENPDGTQQTYLAAREVYKFLNASDKAGIHYRPGTHNHSHEDWFAMVDFADKVLYGLPVTTDLEMLPYPIQSGIRSWSAPSTGSLSPGFQVNPSPVLIKPRGQLQLLSGEPHSIAVFSLDGKRIFSGDNVLKGSVQWAKAGLSNGIYIIRIEGKNDIWRQRVLLIQ